jgi:exopolyphosphatase / guanosine-5'-triphosphate,3'-diphosphate pyrophosphatase
MPRVAVADIGSNSTRLLVCDVQDGRVTEELLRRSTVTRLGQGVDAAGALAQEAMARVLAALEQDAEAIASADLRVAVLTSAVRDAGNGAAFAEEVERRFGLHARTLAGEEEARLSFLGATSERAAGGGRVLVVDIGGGSTELIVGEDAEVAAAASLQMGVVRFGERHIRSDPPAPEELQAVAADARAVLADGRPRAPVEDVIAVAGTATTVGAIDLAVEPYDGSRVHGHRMALGRIEELLARLAQLPLAERREVTGLHPDRAPTIVPGLVILAEVLRAYEREEAEISDHDILRGAALDAAQEG